MRRAAAGMAGVAIALGSSGAAAEAAAGDLDPSFSSDGRVQLPAGWLIPRALAIQPDGRIIVAGATCANASDGTCSGDGQSSFRLARLKDDGDLDPTFAGNAGATLVGSGRSQAFDVLVESDGALLAAGVAHDRAADRDVATLARFDASGRLDQSWGTQGVVLTPIGATLSAIADVAPGPGGSTYAAGQADGHFMVARFTAAGALDESFGTGGVVLAAPAWGYATGLAPTAGGGVLAVGYTADAQDPTELRRFTELKLDASGVPDPAFAPDGLLRQEIRTWSFASAAMPTPDGGWVAAGAATAGDDQAMTIVGGAAGGAGPSWTTAVPTANNAVANDLAVLPDGRIVAAGQIGTATGYAFADARLGADGALDPSWGAGGVATIGWDDYSVARATAVAVDGSGRVVTAGIGCAGGSDAICTGGTAVLLLARQLPAGTPGPAPAPTATATPVPTAVPKDTTKPKARLSGAPRRVSRRALRKKGFRLRIRATEPVRLDVRLTGPRRAARRRTATLDHVALRRLRRDVTIRVRAGRRALRRTRSGRLTLAVRLTDAAGNVATVRSHPRLR